MLDLTNRCLRFVIFIKLEDQAVVYKEDSGYVLADPLLKQHMRRFRL